LSELKYTIGFHVNVMHVNSQYVNINPLFTYSYNSLWSSLSQNTLCAKKYFTIPHITMTSKSSLNWVWKFKLNLCKNFCGPINLKTNYFRQIERVSFHGLGYMLEPIYENKSLEFVLQIKLGPFCHGINFV
jgi:hypothetical protein